MLLELTGGLVGIVVCHHNHNLLTSRALSPSILSLSRWKRGEGAPPSAEGVSLSRHRQALAAVTATAAATAAALRGGANGTQKRLPWRSPYHCEGGPSLNFGSGSLRKLSLSTLDCHVPTEMSVLAVTNPLTDKRIPSW